MARKTATRKTKAGDFGVDFVEVPLTADQKKELYEGTYTAEDLLNGMVHMVEAGFKVSLSYSERSSSYIATYTGPADVDTGRKAACSSHGPSVDVALAAAVYKWTVITDGGNWDLNEVVGEWNSIR